MKRTLTCHLAIPFKVNRAEALVRRLAQPEGIRSLANLLSLDYGREFRGIAGGHYAQALLTMILRRAPNLRCLSIDMKGRIFIPDHLYNKLQHLEIHSPWEWLVQLQPVLPRLRSLRTLCLSCDKSICALSLQKDGHGIKLALENLTELKNIKLVGITPELLTLPEGAELHMHVVCHRCAICRNEGLSMQQLPKQWPNNLEKVVFRCASFGTVKHPIVLRGPWLRVRQLEFTFHGDAHIVVDAGAVEWQLLKIRCWGTLSMRFSDLPMFVRRCPEFLIVCERVPDQVRRQDMVLLLGKLADAQVRMQSGWFSDFYWELSRGSGLEFGLTIDSPTDKAFTSLNSIWHACGLCDANKTHRFGYGW